MRLLFHPLIWVQPIFFTAVLVGRYILPKFQNGGDVSWPDAYNGKIVVLIFAHWCIPCLPASLSWRGVLSTILKLWQPSGLPLK